MSEINLSDLSNEELEKIYKQTKKDAEYSANMSEVLKIFLNSFYGCGALASNPFSSGKLTNASVTISGRCMNKMTGLKISNWVRNKAGLEDDIELTEIVQGDTDSNYLTLDKIIPSTTPIEKALPVIQNIVKEHIEPIINENIKELCELFNVRDDTVLNAENEVISKGFVSIASKRYYTRVLVNDGAILKKPKIKITGIALKGKSTPELAKEKLEPILDIILDKDINDLKEYIEETKQAFIDAPVQDIARNVKVNSLDYKKEGKKYRKWTGEKFLTAPINSHASLVYNDYIKINNLTSQFNNIVTSDTISYIYLNEPNNFYSKTIAFKDPKFTELIKPEYIDVGAHFEKDFKDKIRIITNAIGWNIDSKAEALDDW